MKTKIYVTSIFFLILIFFGNILFAQNADSTNFSKGISLSYWGTLSNNYGLKLGYQNNYIQTDKYKITGTFSFLVNRKPEIYTSVGLTYESALRRTYKSGMYFEHGIYFGYLGSYYDFDFYRTNNDGIIINVGRKWTSSLIFGYSFAFGYDFSKKTRFNSQLFFKPNIYYKFPNNDNIFYLNNYSIEIGFVIHPKWI